eukprot:GHVS01034065.1.p1 GENE.GHVS01034065.1~~GHVS01034065.1.p1  ORF type:complete len:650 (-),score=83.20 GHVS01034065.1:69-2018(-)
MSRNDAPLHSSTAHSSQKIQTLRLHKEHDHLVTVAEKYASSGTSSELSVNSCLYRREGCEFVLCSNRAEPPDGLAVAVSYSVPYIAQKLRSLLAVESAESLGMSAGSKHELLTLPGLVRMTQPPTGSFRFVFRLDAGAEFPFEPPKVNCCSHFCRPSLADGRQLLFDITQNHWTPATTLLDIVRAIPTFLCRVFLWSHVLGPRGLLVGCWPARLDLCVYLRPSHGSCIDCRTMVVPCARPLARRGTEGEIGHLMAGFIKEATRSLDSLSMAGELPNASDNHRPAGSGRPSAQPRFAIMTDGAICVVQLVELPSHHRDVLPFERLLSTGCRAKQSSEPLCPPGQPRWCRLLSWGHLSLLNSCTVRKRGAAGASIALTFDSVENALRSAGSAGEGSGEDGSLESRLTSKCTREAMVAHDIITDNCANAHAVIAFYRRPMIAGSEVLASRVHMPSSVDAVEAMMRGAEGSDLHASCDSRLTISLDDEEEAHIFQRIILNAAERVGSRVRQHSSGDSRLMDKQTEGDSAVPRKEGQEDVGYRDKIERKLADIETEIDCICTLLLAEEYPSCLQSNNRGEGSDEGRKQVKRLMGLFKSRIELYAALDTQIETSTDGAVADGGSSRAAKPKYEEAIKEMQTVLQHPNIAAILSGI